MISFYYTQQLATLNKLFIHKEIWYSKMVSTASTTVTEKAVNLHSGQRTVCGELGKMKHALCCTALQTILDQYGSTEVHSATSINEACVLCEEEGGMKRRG